MYTLFSVNYVMIERLAVIRVSTNQHDRLNIAYYHI